MSQALIPQLILEAGRGHGGGEAISFRGASLSYAELLDRALGCAGFLAREQVRGRPVAIHADRKPSTYAALLGIWLSGNHFLPLPPGCPGERKQKILAEAGPALVLDPDRFSPCAPGALPDIDPASPAYLAYTSGSSGRPKGCVITHANLLAWHEATKGFYDFRPGDRISQAFELTFDPSVSDMLWAFLHGATLCPLHPLELASLDTYLERERITVWSSSPSVARLALEGGRLEGRRFPRLRLSTFIGEKLVPGLAARWRELAPASAIENLYGPAEATISVTRFHAAAGASLPAAAESLPIGAPHPGVELALVSGEAGEELWIGGPQVSPGYLDPARNEGRFVHGELPGFSSRRWYRTGDLARAVPEGGFLFLGRADAQLKIAGRRFEPGEVESLAQAEGLPSGYALPWPSAHEAEGVVFAVAEPPGEAAIARFYAACEKNLPAWAVPSAVFLAPRFPLGVNGKIDRAALLALVAALPENARMHAR